MSAEFVDVGEFNLLITEEPWDIEFSASSEVGDREGNINLTTGKKTSNIKWGDVNLNGNDVIFRIGEEDIELRASDIIEMRKDNEELKNKVKRLEEILEMVEEKLSVLWLAPGMPGMFEGKTRFKQSKLLSER